MTTPRTSTKPKNRVEISLGPRRKRRDAAPHATEAPEPVPPAMFDHIPGLKARLLAARREGRRA